MTELAEIAQAVAMALELDRYLGLDDDKYWIGEEKSPVLSADSLFSPYWRCRCLDWLLDRGDVGFLKGGQGAQFYVPGSDVGEEISLRCPAAEFPARAVAALMDRKE